MWDRTKTDVAWEYIKGQFREWSLPHFLIDGCVSFLIPYVLWLLLSVPWYHLVVLVVLTCGTLTGVILLWMHRVRLIVANTQQRLHTIPSAPLDNRFLLARMPGVAVADFADI